MIKLKKCPFCGSNVKISIGGMEIYVRCPSCGTYFGLVDVREGADIQEELENTIKFWNKRAENVEPAKGIVLTKEEFSYLKNLEGEFDTIGRDEFGALKLSKKGLGAVLDMEERGIFLEFIHKNSCIEIETLLEKAEVEGTKQ